MLRSKRRRIHNRVATALVDRFPSLAAAEPARVAHHFTEAQQPVEAVRYWLIAGQRASERSAVTLAADLLEKARQLLPQVSDRVARNDLELTVLSALGPILMASKGCASSDVEAVFARARNMCRNDGDGMAQFRALRGLFLFHLTRGEILQATELAGELSRHAKSAGDEVFQFEADRVLGTCLFFQGRFLETRSYMQRVVDTYDRERHGHLAVALAQDPGTSGRIYLGWSEWYLGYPERAVALLDDAVRLSQDLRQPHTQAAALLFAAMLRVSRREPAQAKALADQCIELCRQQRFPFWMATAGVVSGWATALEGDADAGIEQIRDGLARWQQTGARLGVPMYLGMLAEALAAAGRADDGLAPLDVAVTMIESKGERFWSAELHRLRGQLLMSSGAEGAAEDSYCKSLEIARSLRARSMELRAALSLARLWERRNLQPAAREMLANARQPFTEGFQCPDLVESDALLARLGGDHSEATQATRDPPKP